MANEDDFITRLTDFGLTEKEAACYFYLLKYGPKTPSPLAKSLHTYREDVHHTLNSLIEKDMVLPSLDSPTVYIAVDLEPALESALKKHEAELREMEAQKRELEELSQQQRFGLSDRGTAFKILRNIKEIVSETAQVILSTEREFVWIAPKEGLIVSSAFGVNDIKKELAERGGEIRGITDITHSIIPFVQELLDIGEDIRHFDGYRGLYYGVFDRRRCISAINIDVTRLKLDEPAAMLYSDDLVYATYLTSTFEVLWKQATPAEKRIQELREQGPPLADE